MEIMQGHFTFSDQKSRLDFETIYRFLSQEAYWAKGISREKVLKGIENALCFGVYTAEGEQVAFCRVICDLATFAYIDDVFVLQAYRGMGLAKWMLENVFQHPELQNIKRWLLATRDAHGLYQKVGFRPLANPDRWLEIHEVEIYQRLAGEA